MFGISHRTGAMHLRLVWFACFIAAVLSDWRSDVLQANEDFEARFENGDYQGVQDLFADSASFFLPDSQPEVSGSEAIKNWFQERQIADSVASIVLTTADVENYVTVASETGSYKLITNTGEIYQTGIYFTTWVNEDGQVKITMMMWVSDTYM